MKQIRIATLMLVCGMLLHVAAAVAESEISRTIDLRPQWKAGDAFYIEWDLSTKYKWSEDGTANTWAQSAHDIAGFILRVEEVRPDDTTKISIIYDRVASAFQGGDNPDDEYSWDSDLDPPDSPSKFRPILQPMMDCTLIVVVDGRGKITSFDGVEELRRKVEQADPDPEIFAWFKTYFTVDSKRAGWDDWFGKYAYEPVERGDEWQHAYTSSYHHNTVTNSLDRINNYQDRVLATVPFDRSRDSPCRS